MQIFSLKAKLVVSVKGVLMILQRRLVDRRLLFFDELGEPTKLTETEFYVGYEKREIEICADQPFLGEVPSVGNVAPDLTCFPANHCQEALRRRQYLEGVMGKDQSKLPSEEIMLEELKKIAKIIGDACAPSISTVRRWASRYIGGDIIRLVPKHNKKGRTAAITGELEGILGSVIDELYLKDTRPKVSKVIGEYRLRLEAFNRERLPSEQFTLPSDMTVRRYIARLDPFESPRVS